MGRDPSQPGGPSYLQEAGKAYGDVARTATENPRANLSRIGGAMAGVGEGLYNTFAGDPNAPPAGMSHDEQMQKRIAGLSEGQRTAMGIAPPPQMPDMDFSSAQTAFNPPEERAPAMTARYQGPGGDTSIPDVDVPQREGPQVAGPFTGEPRPEPPQGEDPQLYAGGGDPWAGEDPSTGGGGMESLANKYPGDAPQQGNAWADYHAEQPPEADTGENPITAFDRLKGEGPGGLTGSTSDTAAGPGEAGPASKDESYKDNKHYQHLKGLEGGSENWRRNQEVERRIRQYEEGMTPVPQGQRDKAQAAMDRGDYRMAAYHSGALEDLFGQRMQGSFDRSKDDMLSQGRLWAGNRQRDTRPQHTVPTA